MFDKESYKYTRSFSIFNNIVEVNAQYEEFLDELEDFLPSSSSYQTADVVLYTELKQTHRYLFRTRPHDSLPLPIYVEENEKIKVWQSSTPPFPPFESQKFKGRYVALHAGAIMDEINQVTLIIGKQGAGKTTLSTKMSNDYGYQYLTDETAIVATGTNYIFPFPRIILPRVQNRGEIVKVKIPAKKIVTNIAEVGGVIKNIVFLEPTDKTKRVEAEDIDYVSCRHRLFESYQYAGTDLKNSFSTLDLIAKTAQAKVISYPENDFQALLSIAGLLKGSD